MGIRGWIHPRAACPNLVVFGSIRAECLDDVIVLSVAGLQRILRSASRTPCTRSHIPQESGTRLPVGWQAVMLVVAPCCWVCTGFADSLVRGGRARDASWCVSELTRLL